MSVYFETQKNVIQFIPMVDFCFGFTDGSFLLLKGEKQPKPRLLLTQRFLTFRCVPCVKIKNTDIVLPVKEGPQLP